jgi:DNA-binding FrmR family transcriptional regulator
MADKSTTSQREAKRHVIPLAGAACGCALHEDLATDGRKAVGVDPDIKDRNLKRLRRIEGQVRGLQKMVESDRYCADILTQISSVHEALRAVGRELMRNHLKHCAAAAIRSDDPADADAMYDELMDMMYKNIR